MTSGARCLTTAVLAATTLGCSAEAPRPLPGREPFVAMERDFQEFERWPKVDLSVRPAIGEAHESGEAHEYINRLPPAGSKSFPVGTILMKTVKSNHQPDDATKAGAETRTDIFAMVKRGAGYNRQGSPGWEWFELRRRDDDSLGIVWRGVNPPNGEGYAGDPLGGCNGCHQMATKNDYVHATALTLARL